MTKKTVTATAAQQPPVKRESMFLATCKRVISNRVSLIGMIILAIIILLGIFASVISPYDPNFMDVTAVNSTPTARHLFGTDNLGRDILSRLLYGTRYSLSLGFICAIFGWIVGVVIGSIVGYAGGHVDMVAMRVCDIISAIPSQLLCILISVALGTGFFKTILAMSIGGIPGCVRSTRAMALKEREMEYLEAAEAMNCSKLKIVYQQMVPNIISPSIVGTTMMIGNTIKSAAGLSFVGLGIQPPTPEWGAMLSGAKSVILTYPHEVLFPGLAILVTILAVNMIGDGLRDALDPKLKD